MKCPVLEFVPIFRNIYSVSHVLCMHMLEQLNSLVHKGYGFFPFTLTET
jgi:hypothetical protein